MPRITVLMPVYCAASTVAMAIDSILQQTFTDFEFLIIDNGAEEDGTSSVLKRHVIERNDPRIRLIKLEHNQGLVNALNIGLVEARAPFIARMDADDVSLPQRLFRQYAEMQAQPNLAALGSYIRLMDKDGLMSSLETYPLGVKNNRTYLQRASPLAHPSVILRKTAVDAVGRYRPFFEGAEDYDLWLRLLDAEYDIDNLPEILLYYRVHAGSMSHHGRRQQVFNSWLAQACHRLRQQNRSEPQFEKSMSETSALALIPDDIKRHAEVEIFEYEHALLSKLPLKTLSEAEIKILQLESRSPSHPAFGRMRMRLACGYWRQRRYGQSLSILTVALVKYPRTCFSMISLKSRFMHPFAKNFADAGVSVAV